MSRREWTVVVLLVFSVVINYVDRSNLSLAVPILEKQFSISSLAGGRTAVGIFLDLCAGPAVRDWRDGWRIAFTRDGCCSSATCCGRLATALTGLTTSFAALFALQTAAGARRVSGVSLLLAHLCGDAAGASRARECINRCGNKAGTGGRRVCGRHRAGALGLEDAVRILWNGRAGMAAALVLGDAAWQAEVDSAARRVDRSRG